MQGQVLTADRAKVRHLRLNRKVRWVVVAIGSVFLIGCGGAKRAEREEKAILAKQIRHREQLISRLEHDRDVAYEEALRKREAEREQMLAQQKAEQDRLLAELSARREQEKAAQDAERERRRQAVAQARMPPEPPAELDLKMLNDADFFEAIKVSLEYHAMRVLTRNAAAAQDSIREMRRQLAAFGPPNEDNVEQFLKNRAAAYREFLGLAGGVTKELAEARTSLESLRKEVNSRVEKLVDHAEQQGKDIKVFRSRLEEGGDSDPGRPATEAILQANEAALKASQAQYIALGNLSSNTTQLIQALEKVEASIVAMAFVMSQQAKPLSENASVIHLTWEEKLEVLAAQNSPDAFTRPVVQGAQEMFGIIRKIEAKNFAKEIPDDVLNAIH